MKLIILLLLACLFGFIAGLIFLTLFIYVAKNIDNESVSLGIKKKTKTILETPIDFEK